jgi:hypothetical protein
MRVYLKNNPVWHIRVVMLLEKSTQLLSCASW